MLSLKQPLNKVIAKSADLKKSAEVDTKNAIKVMKQVAEVDVMDKKQRAMLQDVKKLANSMKDTVLDKSVETSQAQQEDQQQEKEVAFLRDVISKQVEKKTYDQDQQIQQAAIKNKESFSKKPVSEKKQIVKKETLKDVYKEKDYPASIRKNEKIKTQKHVQVESSIKKDTTKKKKLHDVIDSYQQEISVVEKQKKLKPQKQLNKMTQPDKEKVSQILQRNNKQIKTEYQKDFSDIKKTPLKSNKITKLPEKVSADFENKSKTRLKQNMKEKALTTKRSYPKSEKPTKTKEKHIDTTKLKAITYTKKSKKIVKLGHVMSAETEKEWKESTFKNPQKQKVMTSSGDNKTAQAEDKAFTAAAKKMPEKEIAKGFKDSLMSVVNQSVSTPQPAEQQAAPVVTQTPAQIPEELQTAVQWMADDDVENRLVDLLSRQARLRGVDLS